MLAFEIIAEERIRELGLLSRQTVGPDGFPEYRDRIAATLTR